MPPGAGPLTGELRNNGKSGKEYREWWYSKEAETYGRASGVGKYLDDANNLIPWSMAMAVVGMVLNKSARSELVSIVNEFGKDDESPKETFDKIWYGNGKSRLNGAVSNAKRLAGADEASSAGTEFHGYTELLDMGKRPRAIQEEYEDLVDEYVASTQALEFLDAEPFVVQDDLKVAGSIDRIARMPKLLDAKGNVHPISGQVVVADLKTGRQDYRFPLSPTCQVATYANSVRYDQASGVRAPIHPELSTDWGLLVHFPIMTPNPKVRLYPLDLRWGWQAACVAMWVKELRGLKELKELVVAA